MPWRSSSKVEEGQADGRAGAEVASQAADHGGCDERWHEQRVARVEEGCPEAVAHTGWGGARGQSVVAFGRRSRRQPV